MARGTLGESGANFSDKLPRHDSPCSPLRPCHRDAGPTGGCRVETRADGRTRTGVEPDGGPRPCEGNERRCICLMTILIVISDMAPEATPVNPFPEQSVQFPRNRLARSR